MVAAGVVGAVWAVAVAWPAASVAVASMVSLVSTFLGSRAADAGPGLAAEAAARALGPELAGSLGVAAGVAVLSTLAAWPVAATLARLLGPVGHGGRAGRGGRGGPSGCGRRVVAALAAGAMLLPLLLPNYLAYAGWGLARAPGTWLGDALLRVGTAEGGPRWLIVLVGRAFAVLGLALWAMPLAASILAASRLSARGEAEALLRLDAPGAASRLLATARLHAPAIALAWAAVALLSLGSAVPLHVSQMPTLAAPIWTDLAATAASERWALWLRAWPVLAVAAAAGVGACRLTWRRGAEGEGGAGLPAGLPAGWTAGRTAGGAGGRGGRRMVRAVVAAGPAGVVWLAAWAVPLVLLAGSVRSGGAFAAFWRGHAAGVAQSVRVALACGVATALLAGAMLLADSASRRAGVWLRRSARALLLAVSASLAAAAVVPGVLVGLSLLGAYRRVEWFVDGVGAGAASCVARFGVVALAAVAVSRRQGAGGLDDAAALDGADAAPGWFAATLARVWPACAAAGLAAAALSLHEIEAAVVIEPPGPGRVAQAMLNALHFSRLDELAAGAVWLTALALPVAAAAGALGWAAVGGSAPRPPRAGAGTDPGG